MKSNRTMLTGIGAGVLLAGLMIGTGCEGQECPLAKCSGDKASAQKETAKAENAKKGDVWMTEFDVAKSQAKINGKPILMLFTGSDWCPWCVKLEKEILSQDAFLAWAKDNAILLKLDFPRKSVQSEELRKQNRTLAEDYNVEGYPTIVIADDTGKEIARTGYRAGGAEKYVKHLQTLLGGKK